MELTETKSKILVLLGMLVLVTLVVSIGITHAEKTISDNQNKAPLSSSSQ